MIKQLIATTALVGALFVVEPGYSAAEDVAQVLQNYQKTSKELYGVSKQLETTSELISEHMTEMYKSSDTPSPNASEMKALNALLQKDTKYTTQYQELLAKYKQFQKEIDDAREVFFEDTGIELSTLAPVAPPPPPGGHITTKEVQETLKETPAEIEEKSKEAIEKEEPEFAKKEVEKAKKMVAKEVSEGKSKSVVEADVKKQVKTDTMSFADQLKAQAKELQKVEETVKAHKPADPAAAKEKDDLASILRKTLEAKFKAANAVEQYEDEWEDDIDDEWEDEFGPS